MSLVKIVKYASSSLASISLDLITFQLADWALASVWSTSTSTRATVAALTGRAMAGSLAFTLQRRWVFRHQAAEGALRTQAVRFAVGFALGTCLVMTGVWVFTHWVGFQPLPARLTTAIIVWCIMYTYNRWIVFGRPGGQVTHRS